MEWSDVDQEEKGGERRALGGPYREWGGYIGGPLEDKGTLSSRKERGDPVDHIYGNVFGEEDEPKLRRVDIVQASLYVKEECGNL